LALSALFLVALLDGARADTVALRLPGGTSGEAFRLASDWSEMGGGAWYGERLGLALSGRLDLASWELEAATR